MKIHRTIHAILQGDSDTIRITIEGFGIPVTYKMMKICYLKGYAYMLGGLTFKVLAVYSHNLFDGSDYNFKHYQNNCKNCLFNSNYPLSKGDKLYRNGRHTLVEYFCTLRATKVDNNHYCKFIKRN